MVIPKGVMEKLVEKGLDLVPTSITLSPVDDNIMWRFVVEMVENSSRAEACEQLFIDVSNPNKEVHWLFLEGKACGEMFLIAQYMQNGNEEIDIGDDIITIFGLC